MMLSPDTRGDLRVVIVYGSVKPRYCGVEAATTTMHAALEKANVVVDVVKLDDWSVTHTGTLIKRVAVSSPDVILIAYPTLDFDRKLSPVLFSLLQRIAPLAVVLHEFNHVHVLRRLAISALCLRAAQVIVTTEAEKAGLLTWNPWLRRRVTVNPIPSNIPVREWQPSPQPQVTILTQLRPDKGLESFLDCCGVLRSRMAGLTFRIIGSEVPRYSDYAGQIRRMAAERDVTLSENLSDEAVADMLSTATVALLPFPDGATERRSSLIAAAVCGVPIVTTLGCNTPADFVSDLAPLQGQDALVQRTLKYCGDAEARMEAHRRSLRMAERFSTGAVVEKLVKSIKELSATRTRLPLGAVASDSA